MAHSRPGRWTTAASARRCGGVHERSSRLCRVAVTMEPLQQLVRELGLVHGGTSHDEGAVADRVALGTTIDRTGAETDLLGRLPESDQTRLGLLERRDLLPAFSHEFAVPLGIPLIASPKDEPLGLDGARHRLPGHPSPSGSAEPISRAPSGPRMKESHRSSVMYVPFATRASHRSNPWRRHRAPPATSPGTPHASVGSAPHSGRHRQRGDHEYARTSRDRHRPTA